MASQNANKLINDALEDLSQKNFDKFRNALLHRKGETRVKRNQVEGKSDLDIADVLITTFTEDRALAVVVELLKDIGCHQDAQNLEKEIQSSNPGPSDTVRPSAGAEGGCPEADFVDKHRADLIDRVSDIASILDQLLANEIITHGAYDEILAISTKRDQMRKLFSGPLNGAGSRGKKVFYKILEKKEKCLVDDLKERK